MTPQLAPDPMRVHPIDGQDRVVLLKPLITSPLIEVGDYSYYDDPEHALDFQTRNVTHHYGPDRLIIGSFCAIAAGTTFIMNGANHRMNGPSTYPFPIMGAPWAEHVDLITDLPSRGDTVVGNDVWIGGNVTVMPGVHIGHGAIISTAAVVTRDVPDYAIVGGNPATLVRRRFSEEDIQALLELAWWDWPVNVITTHIRTIADGPVAELRAISASLEDLVGRPSANARVRTRSAPEQLIEPRPPPRSCGRPVPAGSVEHDGTLCSCVVLTALRTGRT